jgi:hypothetical protein
MPDWLIPLALALVAFLALIKALSKVLPFVLGPIAVRRVNTVLATPEVTRVPSDQALPDPAKSFFDQTTAQLEKQGCRRHALVAVRTAPEGPHSYAILVSHPQSRVLGMAAALPRAGADWLMYVEFSSEFADGSTITSNNSPIVSPFQPRENSETLCFPWIEAPEKLLRLHQVRVSQAGRGAPVVPGAGQEIAYVREAIEKPVRAQADFGYYRLDEATGLYRLTWAGAFRMTWLSLEPFKGRLEKRMREQTTACLARIKNAASGGTRLA